MEMWRDVIFMKIFMEVDSWPWIFMSFGLSCKNIVNRFFLFFSHVEIRPHVTFKGTLMQIWKPLYICVHTKTIPWKFRDLNSKNSRVLPAKFVIFLKSRLIFNILYCFWIFVNKTFTYLTFTSKSIRCFNMKSSAYYFYTKTKIMIDFQIYISVPLINWLSN